MGNETVWSHEASFVPEPVSASRARDFVSLHLVEHGLRDLVDDVGLVATELVTNALRHAHTSCSVRLAAGERSLLLTVQDGSTTVPVRRSPEPMAARGRGLLIVDVLSGAWGVDTSGDQTKSVWASFAIAPARPV